MHTRPYLQRLAEREAPLSNLRKYKCDMIWLRFQAQGHLQQKKTQPLFSSFPRS